MAQPKVIITPLYLYNHLRGMYLKSSIFLLFHQIKQVNHFYLKKVKKCLLKSLLSSQASRMLSFFMDPQSCIKLQALDFLTWLKSQFHSPFFNLKKKFKF